MAAHCRSVGATLPLSSSLQGLAPLAIHFRPVGAMEMFVSDIARLAQFRVTDSLRFINNDATCDHAACSASGIVSSRTDSPLAR